MNTTDMIAKMTERAATLATMIAEHETMDLPLVAYVGDYDGATVVLLKESAIGSQGWRVLDSMGDDMTAFVTQRTRETALIARNVLSLQTTAAARKTGITNVRTIAVKTILKARRSTVLATIAMLEAANA